MTDGSTTASTPAGTARTLGEGRFLEPAQGHLVWWCEGGDAQGLPVLMVHGGPGGRSRAEVLSWWDGLPVRWIAIDQRGCGQSLPEGGVEHNTLDALIDDMERLREHLGLAQWALAGGSWGALVALSYWLRHPTRVRGLHLRSSFLGTPEETVRYMAPWFDWLAAAGREALGVDALRVARLFRAPAPDEPMTDATVRGLERPGWGIEPLVADAWSRFDDAQAQPGGAAVSTSRWSPPATLARIPPGGWRIFSHYAANGWFLPHRLTDALQAAGPPSSSLPVELVHGDRDACCDPATSRWLAAWCPHARLTRVAGGGHRMNQPDMARALRESAAEWIDAMAAARPAAGTITLSRPGDR